MSDLNGKIRVTTLACRVVLMVGRAHSEEPLDGFQVTTRKTDDRVTVGLHGDRAIFTIMSPSGIGGATITRQGERWPGVIILRLRLNGMERLQVRNGKVTLTASVSSGEDLRMILGLSEGDQKEVPVDRSSPYWTEIRILDAQDRPAREIPVKGGVFEVTLPRALFATSPPMITLDWIDFYR